MAIIDNVKKFSDTVWELPSNYKNAFRSNRGARFRSLGASSRQCGSSPQEIANYLQPAISESGSGCLCAANLLGIFPSRPTRRGKRLKSKQSSQPDTVRSTKQRWRRCEPEEANRAGRCETLPWTRSSEARRPSSRTFENDFSPKAVRLISMARSQPPRERGVSGIPISSRSASSLPRRSTARSCLACAVARKTLS
jgi:hypothetical protein